VALGTNGAHPEVHISTAAPWEAPQDLLVLGLFEDAGLSADLREIDTRLGGALSDALSRRELSGKWLDTWDSLTLGKLASRRLVIVGLGSEDQFTLRELRMAAGAGAQAARRLHAARIAVCLPSGAFDPADAAEAVTNGLLLGDWRFEKYQANRDESGLAEAVVLGLEASAQAGVARGVILGQAQNYVRDLGMRPSNKLYPELLAGEAVQAGQQHGFDVEVFDAKTLQDLGMEAILGIGSGSAHPPAMVIMRYNGGGSRSLALCGKGITFDSGGISLKPALGMEEMKFDMLGAAAVLGTMIALAELKVPLNVVGIMALAQNVPSGTAIKPGDVVKAFNGKTIEVTNTDAEGRVVLADAVSYAAHLGVDWIVETSTLTGAAIIVLGHEASALVAPDDGLASLVLQASEAAGERVWRLPIYPEYRRLYRSETADMKNSPGREAGTITAGMIIAEFAGGVPYAHLDIAGSAWTPAGPLNGIKDGPTGVMVRTFVKLSQMLSH
jgi:leucyl aminopeptidase